MYVCVVNGNFVFLKPRPTASTILSKQSDAQLTIFYDGTLNVYDKIFADKVWVCGFKQFWGRQGLYNGGRRTQFII